MICIQSDICICELTYRVDLSSEDIDAVLLMQKTDAVQVQVST